jgi:hypothetical protein
MLHKISQSLSQVVSLQYARVIPDPVGEKYRFTSTARLKALKFSLHDLRFREGGYLIRFVLFFSQKKPRPIYTWLKRRALSFPQRY